MSTVAETVPPAKPPRRVFQNTLFSVLQKSQSAIFSYVSLRMLLHAMSIEEYGFYTLLFQATLQNLSLLFQLGLPSFLTRFVPEFYTAAKYKVIGKLFRVVNYVQIGFFSLLLLIIFVFARQLTSLLNFPGDESNLRIFAVGALAYLVQENYRTVLGSLFKQQAAFWATFYFNALRLVVIFFVTQYMYSLLSVIVAEVALLGCGLIFFVIAYRRTVGPLIAQDQHPPEPIQWKRYARYTGLCYLNEIGVSLLSGLDLFFVAGLLDAAAVGLYGLANRVLLLINGVMPSMLLKSLIEPLFFSEFGASGNRSPAEGFSMLTKLISMITFPASIWLALMSRPVIVHLFEPKFADAAGILVITAFSLLLLNLKLPLGLVLQTAERIDLLIYVKIVGVLKIGAALWLVPQGNILTMAWISLSASAAEILFMYFFMVRSIHAKGDLFGMLKLVINGGLTAVAFVFMAPHLDSLAGVLLSIPLVAGMFLGLSYLNKPFNIKERDFINRHLKRRVWVF